ncbi:hypothetical protein ACQY0O_005521 [Thecaphora frezii]
MRASLLLLPLCFSAVFGKSFKFKPRGGRGGGYGSRSSSTTIVSYHDKDTYYADTGYKLIAHTAMYTEPEKPIADMLPEEEVANATKPYLDVRQGCQPYPVVRVPNLISAGLKGTGSQSKDCDDKFGQIYAREMYVDVPTNQTLAVATAFYFPKRAFHHFSTKYSGNRWDWQALLQFYEVHENVEPKLLSVAISWDWNEDTMRPEFKKYTATPEFLARFTDGNGRPKLKMDFTKHVKTAHLCLTKKEGTTNPYRFWDDMQVSEQGALELWDAGKRQCPIADNWFKQNVYEAWAQKPEEKLPKD